MKNLNQPGSITALGFLLLALLCSFFALRNPKESGRDTGALNSGKNSFEVISPKGSKGHGSRGHSKRSKHRSTNDDAPLSRRVGSTDIIFKRVDITREHVDVIVNAANNQLRAGSGVCGAIFGAAGNQANAMQQACYQAIADRAWNECPTGQACITPSFGSLRNAGITHVIHAVGPRAHRKGERMNTQERQLLRDAYQNSLRLAEQNGLTSIAFPFISSGIFGCDRNDACDVAISAVVDYFHQKKSGSSIITRVIFALHNQEDLDLFMDRTNHFNK